jgi:hypothetical protein
VAGRIQNLKPWSKGAFEVYDSTEEAIKSFHPHPEAAAELHFKSRFHSKTRWRAMESRLDSERIAVLERKIGQQTMEIEFLKKSCGVSRSILWESSPMAAPHLRTHPGSDRSRGRRESSVPDQWPEPSRTVPFSAAS